MMAIGIGIAITEQCGYKAWPHHLVRIIHAVSVAIVN